MTSDADEAARLLRLFLAARKTGGSYDLDIIAAQMETVLDALAEARGQVANPLLVEHYRLQARNSEARALAAGWRKYALQQRGDDGEWIAMHEAFGAIITALDGDADPPAATDATATHGQQTTRQTQGDEKLTPDAWCQRYQLDIRDPDGWRGKNDPSWDTPITLPDFWERYNRSTVRNLHIAEYERILADVEAARERNQA